VRDRPWLWRQGEVFLGNPFEVHAGGNPESAIDYEVYYPNVEWVSECFGLSGQADQQPRFATAILKDPLQVQELMEALAGVRCSSKAGQAAAVGRSAAVEAGLWRFFRRHAGLVYLTSAQEVAPIREACRILQQSVDSPIHWADLPRQVGCSRPHFIRLFHKTTGLAPNVYFRQLRLSKALRLICSGHSLAAAAADSGFTDQAHFTREFKRAFGRTPGKVAQAIVG
jgi:AraC-like DNA-binding protein